MAERKGFQDIQTFLPGLGLRGLPQWGYAYPIPAVQWEGYSSRTEQLSTATTQVGVANREKDTFVSFKGQVAYFYSIQSHEISLHFLVICPGSIFLLFGFWEGCLLSVYLFKSNYFLHFSLCTLFIPLNLHFEWMCNTESGGFCFSCFSSFALL